VDPLAVKAVLPSVAAKYEGVSGPCVLNEYGDRVNPGYDIWGYISVDDQVQIKLYGWVNTENKVKWLR
jgi:hypothetical protein